MTTSTDPTGATFISYRRSRARDVATLARALGDRGVPTWVDTRNLRAEPTAHELHRVLGDPRTSAAIMAHGRRRWQPHDPSRRGTRDCTPLRRW